MSGKKLFISYSRKDKTFVVQLAEALASRGQQVWFDHNIETGNDWDEVLEAQILAADHMIVVLSTHSVDSDYVKNELFFAQQNGIEVNPILIEQCRLPLAMSRMHYIDFRDRFEEGIVQLLRDLSSESSSNDSRKSPPKAQTTKTKFLVYSALIVVLALATWMVWPKDDVINDGSEQVDDSAWRKLDNNSPVQEYVNYIANYGNEELHLVDAMQQVQSMLKHTGVIILDREEIKAYFYKLAFKFEDRYIVNRRDGENFEWPNKGDLLVARKQLRILDPLTYDIKPGEMIEIGQVVQYDIVKEENEGATAVLLYYTPTTSE